MSNKIVFTKTELNKFLLLGDTGEYLIDKINPCIRGDKTKRNFIYILYSENKKKYYNC